MSTITVVGVDLAKRSFHIYGVDEGGKKVVSRSLSREKFLDFFCQSSLLPGGYGSMRKLRLCR